MKARVPEANLTAPKKVIKLKINLLANQGQNTVRGIKAARINRKDILRKNQQVVIDQKVVIKEQQKVILLLEGPAVVKAIPLLQDPVEVRVPRVILPVVQEAVREVPVQVQAQVEVAVAAGVEDNE